MSLNPQDFGFVADLTRKSAAIVLEPGKEYLVESRLQPVASEQGFTRLEDLIARLRDETAFGPLHARVVDALTVNETYFFRDTFPFDALRTEILPGLIARRGAQKKLRIWSAACSTGQEPYSVALLLHEHFPSLADWEITLLATDYSDRVLEQARRGEYNQVEVNRGLPAHYLVKHFVKHGERWTIKETLRNKVDFRRFNLIDPWPAFETFDLILLRNVLIYFDVPTKQAILHAVRQVLRPDGYLLLGAAETTLNIDAALQTATYGKATFHRTCAQPR